MKFISFYVIPDRSNSAIGAWRKKAVKTETQMVPGQLKAWVKQRGKDSWEVCDVLLYTHTLPEFLGAGACFPGSIQVMHLGPRWSPPGRHSPLLGIQALSPETSLQGNFATPACSQTLSPTTQQAHCFLLNGLTGICFG